MRRTTKSIIAIGLLVSMTVFLLPEKDDIAFAQKIIIPRISLERFSYSASDIAKAYVTGYISPAAGQTVTLYSSDRKQKLGLAKTGTGGGIARFAIRIPESTLKNRTSVTLYIKSNVAGQVAASKYIAVAVVNEKEKKAQADASKAKQNTAATTAKKAATTKKATTAKKATNTQKSAKATNPAKTNTAKKAVKKKKPRTAAEGRAAAVAWAREIAADNRFTYGTLPYSAHNGCYFCGTNGGKKRRAKGTKWANGYKGRKWNRTYCCNPFVHACYAHGAQHPKMLRYCRMMNTIDMTKASYRKMGCFKCLGKPKFSKLIAGDIFVGRSHVWLYCGNGEMAEATSIDGKKKSWSADSIRVTKKARQKYSRCRFVMRFTGY